MRRPRDSHRSTPNARPPHRIHGIGPAEPHRTTIGGCAPTVLTVVDPGASSSRVPRRHEPAGHFHGAVRVAWAATGARRATAVGHAVADTAANCGGPFTGCTRKRRRAYMAAVANGSHVANHLRNRQASAGREPPTVGGETRATSWERTSARGAESLSTRPRCPVLRPGTARPGQRSA